MSTSEISALERELLTHLRKFRSSITVGQPPRPDTVPADIFKNELDTFITRLENDSLESFSATNSEALEELDITQKGILYLRRGTTLREAITASQSAGSEKLWSNDYWYKHLSFLTKSMDINETPSQMVIDTFFFRLIAMIPSPQKLIMMKGNQILDAYPRLSQADTVSGITNYTAIVAESSIAEMYIYIPPMLSSDYGDKMIAFFVAEAKAKANPIPLEDNLPQVLVELVACAKYLKKSHIRGALTTGFKWYFLVVDLNTNGDGAKYWVSEPIIWWTKQGSASKGCCIEETSNEFDPAPIVGILSSWVPLNYTEFNGDQWFFQCPREGGILP